MEKLSSKKLVKVAGGKIVKFPHNLSDYSNYTVYVSKFNGVLGTVNYTKIMKMVRVLSH